MSRTIFRSELKYHPILSSKCLQKQMEIWLRDIAGWPRESWTLDADGPANCHRQLKSVSNLRQGLAKDKMRIFMFGGQNLGRRKYFLVALWMLDNPGRSSRTPDISFISNTICKNRRATARSYSPLGFLSLENCCFYLMVSHWPYGSI